MTQRIADHNLVQQSWHDERNAADKDWKEAEKLKASADRSSEVNDDEIDGTVAAESFRQLSLPRSRVVLLAKLSEPEDQQAKLT